MHASENHGRRRRRPNAATVLAGTALFVALGGTATAASGLIDGKTIRAGTVASKQLKSNAVTGAKVKNGSLSASDFSRRAAAALRGPKGDTGAPGATGPAGPAGPAGPIGPIGPIGAQGVQGEQGLPGTDGVIAPEVTTLGSRNLPADATTTVLLRTVPRDRYVVFAKLNLFSLGTDQVRCQLQSGATEMDEIRLRPAAASLTTPVSLQGITATTTESVRVVCITGTDAGSTSDVKIIALPVG